MADQPSGPAPTLGAVMYQNSAATGLDQARSIMERGKARDAPVPEAPPVTTERDAITTALYGPAPAPAPTQSAKAPPAPKPPAPSPASSIGHLPNTGTKADGAAPEGVDPALWGEWTEASAAMKLDKAGADRLVALHSKAVQAQYDQHSKTTDEWRAATAAAYSQAELRDIASAFNERIGTDADAQEARRLLAWSGIGNNLAFVRTIERLLRSR